MSFEERLKKKNGVTTPKPKEITKIEKETDEKPGHYSPVITPCSPPEPSTKGKDPSFSGDHDALLILLGECKYIITQLAEFKAFQNRPIGRNLKSLADRLSKV